jgi:hypothetical protein
MIRSNHRLTQGELNYPDAIDRMSIQSRIPVRHCASVREPVQGIWDNTPLSTAFFSAANISIIQNALRRGVYVMSNGQYLIGPQDCSTLTIIMRSIFLQFSRNLLTNIREQIEQLNKKVLNYCIPQVFSEVQGYVRYIGDIDKIPTPIALPTYTDHRDNSLVLNSPGF